MVGAVAGYCISVLKGAPIQLYMTSLTVTFGASSLVFYSSYHYLHKGMGDTLWTWMLSGAVTGIAGGILSNPRYLPATTLCFTLLGASGYYVCPFRIVHDRPIDFWAVITELSSYV